MLTAAHIQIALKAAGAGGGLVMPAADIAKAFNDAIVTYGEGQFDTVNKVAALVSECMMESAYFRTTEEYAKNGRYAPYIGRTFIQVTWKANYLSFGKWCWTRGLVGSSDYFVNNPQRLADLKWCALGGVWYFTSVMFEGKPLTAYSDNIDQVGGAVNRGNLHQLPSGWKPRRAAYKAVQALGPSIIPTTPDPPPPDPSGLELGSATERCIFEGVNTTTRTRNMTREARRLFTEAGGGIPPGISQGGFNTGGVAASEGTHDRDAQDNKTAPFSPKRAKLWQLCAWTVGGAGWLRPLIVRLWNPHFHWLPKGGDLSKGADKQIVKWFAGRDGLVSNRAYPLIGKLGYQHQTWERYVADFPVRVDAAGLVEAFANRTTTGDVRKVQQALNRMTGTELLVDGDPGPITRKVYASFDPDGIPDVDSMARLKLAVDP